MYNWRPCYISRGLNITALYTAFSRKCDRDFYFGGESHNFWELVCVLDGTVGVAADSRIYSVPANKMILHRPMEFHRIWTEGSAPAEIAIVSFAADFNIKFSGTVFDIAKGSADEVRDIIESIKSCFEMRDSYDAAGICVYRQISPYAQTVINRLENFIMNTVPHSTAAEVTRSSAAGVRKYTEIVNCLTENIGINMTIADVAKCCNMSQSSVKQIFHRYAGMGVAQFYRQLKINSAIAMLSQDRSIKEISLSLGFPDSNYFSTVFKRVTGKSPTDYLRDLRKLSGQKDQ